MCPNCPRCNDSVNGCQELFGSNMRPVGGILGGMNAFGGGAEQQMHGARTRKDTSSVHTSTGLCKKALRRSRANLCRCKVASTSTHTHLHESDLHDSDMHEEFKDRVEDEKAKSFADTEHDAMCTTPSYLAKDALGKSSRATLGDALEQPDLLGKLAENG